MRLDADGSSARPTLIRGWSGATAQRPALTRLLRDAAKSPRPFDAVMVWKLDRLARSVMDLAAINSTFDNAGVGFLSLTEQFDLTTPHGKLLRTILSGFAQFERDILSERTKLGMERARRAGKHVGRPRRSFLPLNPYSMFSAFAGSALTSMTFDEEGEGRVGC